MESPYEVYRRALENGIPEEIKKARIAKENFSAGAQYGFWMGFAFTIIALVLISVIGC